MRSVLAVAAGFVVWSIIWLGCNAILAAVFPDAYRSDGAVQSAGVLSVILSASVLCSLAAGCTTATVSKGGTQRNVLILAVILLAVGLAVEIAGWHLTPVWYHIAFLILLVPATIAGAKLRKRG